jgi:Fe-S cluster assembly protein SufD
MKNFYDFKVDNIKGLSAPEKEFRNKELDLFSENGFPNKREEAWKFTDLNTILSKNFANITNDYTLLKEKKFELIKEFDHNYLIVLNGKLVSSEFKFEDKNKFLIKEYDYKKQISVSNQNSLNLLNNALATGGYYLEISRDYKFKKPLVVYNHFSESIKEQIISYKNSLILNENSKLTILNYTDTNSKNNFFVNSFGYLKLKKDSNLKNIFINKNRCNCYFHDYLKSDLEQNTNLDNYILSTGLKFNKIDIEINLNEEHAKSSIFSALSLGSEEHQEIKSSINHNFKNCQSYQKIKNVLNDQSRGVYQGKIFVKQEAQKTDAYQLSKALLLNDNAEFDAKPELEIYADDVKCSHGSTSGSIDLNSIHYLKSRGIPEKEAYQMLINGFLSEILEKLPEDNLKKFLLEKIERQINGY